MKREELLSELRRILVEYLPENEGQELADSTNKDNVRFVLLELGKRKKKAITQTDEDILAEVAFYFA